MDTDEHKLTKQVADKIAGDLRNILTSYYIVDSVRMEIKNGKTSVVVMKKDKDGNEITCKKEI